MKFFFCKFYPNSWHINFENFVDIPFGILSWTLFEILPKNVPGMFPGFFFLENSPWTTGIFLNFVTCVSRNSCKDFYSNYGRIPLGFFFKDFSGFFSHSSKNSSWNSTRNWLMLSQHSAWEWFQNSSKDFQQNQSARIPPGILPVVYSGILPRTSAWSLQEFLLRILQRILHCWKWY